MQSIKGEICTIKDMNRINKKRNHCQFGDDPFYGCRIVAIFNKSNFIFNTLYFCSVNTNYIQYFIFSFNEPKLYSILYIFIQYTLFQFSNLIFYSMRNFHSIISAVLSVSGLTHIKNMAG